MVHERSFLEQLAQSWPVTIWEDMTILVAVSGGPDSVALLRGLIRLANGDSGKLVVGHFNHLWRGAASDADQKFVSQLCAEHGISFEAGKSDLGGSATDEATARRERYNFLITAAERLGARFLATAHTADDQVETVLHRILRGTGIHGLAGIPRYRNVSEALTIVRPLLPISRETVSLYLKEIGQAARTDTSNFNTNWTRNRIRHDLLPTLVKDFNQAAPEAILRLSELAEQAQEVIQPLVEIIYARAVRKSNQQVCLHCRLVSDEPPYLISEVFKVIWRRNGWPQKDMSSRKWQVLARMVCRQDNPRTRVFPGGIQVSRSEGIVTCRKLD